MGEIRLLIADSDAKLRADFMERAALEGYAFDEACDGICALKLFRRHGYSLIVLNAELPELDGLSACRQIRKVSDVPVVLLSTSADAEDCLYGFEMGADDYVRLPVDLRELFVRVRALLRRSGAERLATPRRLTYEGLHIDTVSRTVYVDEIPVQLTPREYDLLVFLMKNPNRALSRETLLNEVWGSDFFGTDRTVDTHIKTLREAIKPYHNCIATVWGFGYKFAC